MTLKGVLKIFPFKTITKHNVPRENSVFFFRRVILPVLTVSVWTETW